MHRILKTLLYLCCTGILLIVAIFLFMYASQETAQLNDNARKAAPGAFVTLEHGPVHYRLLGPGTGRLVVLIHGGGTTGIEVWQHNIPWLLSRGYRVLAYDLYGRGYSERPDVIYDITLFRRQLQQLMDTLQLKGPLDIVAMSMGASIALDYAAQHPQNVHRIVLLDPAASGDMTPSKMLEVPVLSPLLLTMYWYPRSVENQRREFVNQPLFNSYAKRLAYFMNFKGHKQITLSSWQHIMHNSVLHLLKDIPPGRIMLIYGKQDVYFPAEFLPRYTKFYPSMVAHAIDSAGHMPHYEKPDAVNPLLTGFLQ